MKTPVHRLLAFTAVVLAMVGSQLYRPAHSAVSENSATFQGHYLHGFEVSSFVPCGMQIKPGYGKGYWLETNNEFFKAYEALFIKRGDRTFGGEVVFARFEGKLGPKAEAYKGYGHMGSYLRKVEVKKLLEVRFPTDKDCK